MYKTIIRAFTLAMLACFVCTSCSDDVVEQNIIVDPNLTTYEINKAALRKMDTGQPIAVTGHKSQDPDAVCSAISMAALLRQLGMDATPYIQDKAVMGVKYILDYTSYKVPEVKTTIAPGMPLFMTDHNDYLQALDGAKDANVVGVVDHHGVSANFTSGAPIYCKFMSVGSTNTIVYTIYRECGITPAKDIAQLMVAGIIADTDSLTMSTTTEGATWLSFPVNRRIAAFNEATLTDSLMALTDKWWDSQPVAANTLRMMDARKKELTKAVGYEYYTLWRHFFMRYAEYMSTRRKTSPEARQRRLTDDFPRRRGKRH